MRRAIEQEDREMLRTASLEYAALLRIHIVAEERELFPMGRARLDTDDVRMLCARFDEISDNGPPQREYADLADRLRTLAGLAD